MPVRITVNSRKGHSLMRSARVPETMDAVVAQNTIWKNQSEAAAYIVAPSLASPLASAAGSGMLTGEGVPKKPPSTPVYMRL